MIFLGASKSVRDNRLQCEDQSRRSGCYVQVRTPHNSPSQTDLEEVIKYTEAAHSHTP
jgi:hypothetical protein